MPEDWKLRVIAKMKERRISKVHLAKQIGVDPSNLSRTLTPVAEGGYHGSAHAPLIGELVGEPLPGAPQDDASSEAHMLLRRLRLMSPMLFDETLADLKRAVDAQERALKKVRNRKR
jgi:hypothetical protein